MKLLGVLIAAAALAACTTVQSGELRASNGRDAVWITDKPCTSAAVLARVAPQWRERLREARARWNGDEYRACWIVNGSDAHLLYEDGDQGIVPLADFKQDGA